MTIPKGAKMKGVSMMDIVSAFMKAGFTLKVKCQTYMVMMHLIRVLLQRPATTQLEASNATQNTETNTTENTEANAEDTVTDSERRAIERLFETFGHRRRAWCCS